MSLLRWTTISAAIFVLTSSAASPSWAQGYPSKPIRWIVPTSAGSGADTVGRTIATGVTEVLGQQTVVENRAGAAGNIAAEIASKAPADGYTIFQVNFSHGVNATLYKKLPYDLLRDFAPVTMLGSSPALIVVHPSLPVKTLKQLVSLAKAKPGAINYASAGAGSPTFIGGELFKSIAGIDLLHVPYRGGGEAITAMVSGETSVYFAPLASAMPHVRSGRLRPLAAMSATRIPLAPDVPTVGELGFGGSESGFWHGIMVPSKTPPEIIKTLHAATVTALKRPDVSKRLNDMGYSPVGDPPEQFLAFLKAEIAKWRKIIQEKGLTAG